jgi:hypothetical protein
MSTDVSEARAASIIALMMEAVRTSEMSVNIQLRTQQYIPEDSELQSCSTFPVSKHKSLEIIYISHLQQKHDTKHIKTWYNAHWNELHDVLIPFMNLRVVT